MVCSKCRNQGDEGERFCRKCGTDLETASLASVKQNFLQKESIGERMKQARSRDPDELTGNGIGSVIVGDGFFMVAVILSATASSVSSLLWLLLLIPAFFFFGKGFADVLHARQIRRRMKQNELGAAPIIAEQPSPFTDVFQNHTSSGLILTPSVTERTTRQLK